MPLPASKYIPKPHRARAGRLWALRCCAGKHGEIAACADAALVRRARDVEGRGIDRHDRIEYLARRPRVRLRPSLRGQHLIVVLRPGIMQQRAVHGGGNGADALKRGKGRRMRPGRGHPAGSRVELDRALISAHPGQYDKSGAAGQDPAGDV
ncbi:hypothetical protein U8Q07_16535 [Rhizobium ruizarguesonis]|nr:hypothetical protein U8Q07_16535 [Rhizobium ruizarguesonis]